MNSSPSNFSTRESADFDLTAPLSLKYCFMLLSALPFTSANVIFSFTFTLKSNSPDLFPDYRVCRFIKYTMKIDLVFCSFHSVQSFSSLTLPIPFTS